MKSQATKSTLTMAYADPPYPGQSKKHYEDHPDYAGEVDHPALITQLVAEYPEGWALSTTSSALRDLLPLCPAESRVLAWVKPFATIKKGVDPTYAWEPVIMCGGRNRFGERDHMCRDWVSATPPIFTRRTDNPTRGEKPVEFCYWLFECLGAVESDDLVDMFPGSGAVTRAWDSYWRQRPLGPSEDHHTEPMFEGEKAA